MDAGLDQVLAARMQMGGHAYIRDLAAAEAAVRAGRFNLAKVLRAAAHAYRAMGMDAGRLLNDRWSAQDLLDAHQKELQTGKAVSLVSEAAALDPQLLEAARRRHERVAARLQDILQRASASLKQNSDVLESDVAQTIWGCHGCGFLIEGDPPDACPVCGALSIEFEPFEPFYSSTAEHLGHSSPEAMIRTLAAIPAEVEQLFHGVDEASLGRKPSAEEWSPKEIVGHIIEVEALFNRRVHYILEEQGEVDLGPRMPPWRLHEGKGYETMTGAELVSRLKDSRRATVAYLSGLGPDQWTSSKGFPGGVRNVMELGAWLTNHDVGHVAQIRRYVPSSQ